MAQTWVANNFAEQIIPSEMQETQMLKQLKVSENFYAKHRAKQIQRTNCHITLVTILQKHFYKQNSVAFILNIFNSFGTGITVKSRVGRERKTQEKPPPRL